MLLTLAVLSFSLLIDTNFPWTMIPLGFFILLKMCIFFLCYIRIKYKDDGRDYVTFAEFVTIHMLFSYLNAWITYQTLYTFLWNLNDWTEYHNKGANEFIDTRYYLKDSTIPAKIGFVVIFIEMSINLTYFKDVVFSLCTLINYIGMLQLSIY